MFTLNFDIKYVNNCNIYCLDR